MKDGGGSSMPGSRDNLRTAKFRTTLQQHQSKPNIGTVVRSRVPERQSVVQPPRSLYTSSRTVGRPQSQGGKPEKDVTRFHSAYSMRNKMAEVDKKLEKLVADSHDQAMKDIDKQLAALRERIGSNRELLESTTKTIQSINLEEDKKRAQGLKAARPIKYTSTKNFTDLGNVKDWDKRLEDVTAEINRLRMTLKSNNAFHSNIASDLDDYHRVLTKTIKTIRDMSAKSKEHEATPEELKLLLNAINDSGAPQANSQLAIQKAEKLTYGNAEKLEMSAVSGGSEESHFRESEFEDDDPTTDY